MSVITPSDLSFNGDEVKSLSEAILSAVYNKPSITEFHTLITGIEAKKQIAILGLLGLVGKNQSGTCAPAANPGVISNSQKFWEPMYIEDRFNQCWKDLQGTFFIWGLKQGVNKADLTSTDFANFLEERLTDAIQEAVFRLAWFGDTDAENFNSSPAGVITDGTDVGYFNAIDGFWKQIFAIVAETPAQYEAIPNNAGATYDLQKFVKDDVTNQVVTGIMQDLKDNADTRLSEGTDAIFIVTKSVGDQYKRERKLQFGIDLSYERVETGIDKLVIDGVPIYVFSFWDRMIRAYENNGTKYNLPHRIVYTTISNLQIGIEEESNLGELNPFYDFIKKEFNVDFGWNLDAKFIEDYKGMFAY